ncbi:unnamed protein product [Candidula unifasciata]|uniref:Glutathione transferase n=1 Tax=Candidula unifasciata TaxID=100452 RepID=A0A8S3YT39_9EUPU|nr:unnamed protein product [Candidula unifasciata]
MAPKSMRLIYFDARGKAEISRLVLAAAGQTYEDVRLTKEQWPAEKPNTPFLQLPVLEIDGKRYGQSIAIATYLAREFGFCGKSNIEELQINQAIQLAVDLMNTGSKAFYESDPAKKFPKYFQFFEKLLKESGTGFVVGNSLTLADIVFYDLVFNYISRKVASIEGYPLLQALSKTVESNEKIKAYLAARKPTEF